jgi:hypothetical protein
MKIHGVCSICGTDHAPGASESCIAIERDSERAEQELRARYRLRPGDAGDPERLRSFQAALRQVEALYQEPLDIAPESALEAHNWWFIPHGWIGCAGHIVDKADGHVNVLGSCHSLDLCFWAHERGIRGDVCDLVITKVLDRAKAVAILRELDVRSPFNSVPARTDGAWLDHVEIERALANLPATFSGLQLWFGIPHLRRAEEEHVFEFEVH